MRTLCSSLLFSLSIPLQLLSTALAAEPAAADTEGTTWDVEAAYGPTHTVSLSLSEGTWMSVTTQGERVIFDLLGDLWSMPLSGGEATRLTQGAAWDTDPRLSPDGQRVAYVSDKGGSEQIWVMNVDGTDARPLTDDPDARFTDPVWDPSGPWILGRRRTVDTRSIGVTELWLLHLDGGKGVALTSKDEHPHAGEATFSADGRAIYFSSRSGRFEYDQNPVGGLWSIQRIDRATGEIRHVLGGPGSAARPTLTPDGRSLVFVSRDRDRTLLEQVELETGARRVLADWISVDQMEGFALHGVYPGISFASDGRLLLWSGGKLWRLGLDGQKSELPFHVQGSWTLHDVPRWPRPLPDQVRARVVRWPTWNQDGAIAFSAMGALWVRRPDGAVERVSPGTGYSPAWSPDGQTLAWTSWDDETGGQVHLTRKGKTETLPLRGQLVNPAWSEDGSQIVVLRAPEASVDADLGDAPWFEITLLTRSGKKGPWESAVVTTTANRGAGGPAPRLTLRGGRVWYMEDRPGEPRGPSTSALVSVKLDGTDKRDHLSFGGADFILPSPDLTRVAYQQGHAVYVTAIPPWGKTVSVEAAGLPVLEVTKAEGSWLGWTPDSEDLTWAEGPVLRRRPLSGEGALATPKKAEKDGETAAAPAVETIELKLELPRARPQGVVAYTHARVITLRGDEVIEDATVIVDGDRIRSVSAGGAVPAGAEVVDCTGKTIIPGLIDVHAHLHFSSGDVLPEQEWRYQTALDFGVTTVHDPSASTELVFTQAERVEAGLMEGPRVYSTGAVLYGALGNGNAVTPDREAAKGHIARLTMFGAQSVKVYQQSRREQRQWYAVECVAQKVLCVTEGGGDLWQDLTMVVDGMHAVEHSLSVSPLYADVLGLLGGSPTADTLGTANSPTLLVAYGGMSGENWFYQHMNPLDDARLLRHYPRRALDARTWRLGMMAQDADWNHMSVARDTAALMRAGSLTTLGAHGQLQGLGVHWELWALAGEGAMTPLEALRAGTLNGAKYLGMDAWLGSVEAGKVADFVVLDRNPLEDIHHTTAIHLTVKNGVRYP